MHRNPKQWYVLLEAWYTWYETMLVHVQAGDHEVLDSLVDEVQRLPDSGLGSVAMDRNVVSNTFYFVCANAGETF